MTPQGSIPPHERGAALLAVLVLVAIMGAISVAALEKMRLSTALAINNSSIDQARAYSTGIGSLLTLTIDDLTARSPERTTLAGNWNGATRNYPLPGGGLAEATVSDGGNCFNINSVVEESAPGVTNTRLAGVDQFTGLLRILEVDDLVGRRIAEGAADWADSDAEPNPNGAEDAQYSGADTSYRVGNTLFADVSELRLLADMTPDIYQRIRPWLCVLPTTELSAININTLLPQQAPLLAMLAPQQIGIADAQQLLARRGEGGWSNLVDFWSMPELADLNLPLEIQLQPQVRTRWFALKLEVEVDGASVTETHLIDGRSSPSKIAIRRWGTED